MTSSQAIKALLSGIAVILTKLRGWERSEQKTQLEVQMRMMGGEDHNQKKKRSDLEEGKGEGDRDGESGRDWQDVTQCSWVAAALLSNHIVSTSTRSFNLMEVSNRQKEGMRV